MLHPGCISQSGIVQTGQGKVEGAQLRERSERMAVDRRLPQHQFAEVGQRRDLLEARVVESDPVEKVITEGQLLKGGNTGEKSKIAAAVAIAVRVAVPDRAGEMKLFQMTEPAQALEVRRIHVHSHPVEHFHFEVARGKRRDVANYPRPAMQS